LDPDEVWTYQATGRAINLFSPPSDPALGLQLVAGTCNNVTGSVPGSTAYTNIGIVTIPGDSDSDPSSYCGRQPSTAPPVVAVEIIKYTNGQDANDPNGPDVPVIAPGDPVVWTYDVTNTGTGALDKSAITVTDNLPGVNPVFSSVKSGNADDVLDPDEVWTYQATGTAINLVNPPADPGLQLVTNTCNNATGGVPNTTAYTNIGTVTIPGTSDTDPSSYCGPLLSALGDYVWLDKNQDGIQDTDESPVPGVTVKLLSPGANNQCDIDDAELATTMTDANGKYLFDNLPGGNYCVLFVAPTGYSFTKYMQGSNPAIDSDANTTTGLTGLITLPLGVTDLTWDAGLYQLGPTNLGDGDQPGRPVRIYLPSLSD